MRSKVLFLLTAAVMLAIAAELPCPTEPEPMRGNLKAEPEAEIHAIPWQPVWRLLEEMTEPERANAVIDIEAEGPVYRQIERLWNSGDYAAALELFRQVPDAALGISYRVPVQTPSSDWGNDVVVAELDSVQGVRFDKHWPTGNLYAVVRYEGDGYQGNLDAYRSTNGGVTWGRTYHLVASTYRFHDHDIACQDSHVYLWYVGGTSANLGRLRRLRASTGHGDTFPNGEQYLSIRELPSGSILNVSAATKADTVPNDRLYLALLTSNHEVEAWWLAAPTSYDTHRLRGLPRNSGYGLDLVRNSSSFSAYYLLFSYVDTANYLQVWGVRMVSDSCHRLYSGMLATGAYTSIAAWDDTFHVAFTYPGTQQQARYVVSYEGGTNWRYGAFGDTLGGFVRIPSISGRRGNGVGAVYWQYPQNPYGLMYQYRRYAGPWTTPVRVQSSNSYSMYLPAVEWIEPGVMGVVFFYTEEVYFDRSDWTGVAERPQPQTARLGLRSIPGRGRLKASFNLPTAAHARLRLYDAGGRLVAADAAEFGAGEQSVDMAVKSAGLYFLSLEAAGQTAVVKTFVVE